MQNIIEFQLVSSFIVQREQPCIEVEGRFIKGNILTVGNVFNLLSVEGNSIPVKLKIDKIESFKRNFDSLSLGMVAKLLLTGEFPPEMESKNYLFEEKVPILIGYVSDLMNNDGHF